MRLAGRSIFFVFPIVGALALVAAACAPTEEEGATGSTEVPEEIVIGATLPLTGEEADAGGYFKEGYELAFKEIEQEGGLQLGDEKVPVTLKLLDDTSEPSTAVNLAERLVEDGAHALLGTYSTTLVQAQSTAAEREGIPYVNGGGAATAIYQRDYQWVFGALAPVQTLATSEMEWVAEQQANGNIPEPARIAVIWENTSHGEDYLRGIEQYAEQSGGAFEVVMDESFELNTKDYSAVLSKAQNEGADLFMADAHLPDFLTMHRQYISRDMCHEVITYGARGSEQDAVEVVGQQNVNYILSAVWWHAQLAKTQPDVNEHFIELFENEYGRTPEWYGALAYDTARALFTAIEEAGSVDPQSVRDALVNLEMESVVPGGTLSFPADTGYQADYPFVVQQNQPNGSSPIIYPDQLATGEGMAPNPACKG